MVLGFESPPTVGVEDGSAAIAEANSYRVDARLYQQACTVLHLKMVFRCKSGQNFRSVLCGCGSQEAAQTSSDEQLADRTHSFVSFKSVAETANSAALGVAELQSAMVRNVSATGAGGLECLRQAG
jgi:hypothetical protein